MQDRCAVDGFDRFRGPARTMNLSRVLHDLVYKPLCYVLINSPKKLQHILGLCRREGGASKVPSLTYSRVQTKCVVIIFKAGPACLRAYVD